MKLICISANIKYIIEHKYSSDIGGESLTSSSMVSNVISEEFIGPRGLINRADYIRLLEQALDHLGYPELAVQLERDSGIVLQPPTATAFREAILSGNYEAALNLLPHLGSNLSSMHRAKFLILRQKYCEAIAAGDLKAALHCLRNELQPLQHEHSGVGIGALKGSTYANITVEALHGLASMLVSESRGASSVSSSSTLGRESLLAELQALLPPSLLVPEARLEDLIEQALLVQLDKCPYHNSRGPLRMSLFTEFSAGPEQLPTELTQVLTDHTDEVWAVQFSFDGRWMATASKDGSALLWAVSEQGAVVLEKALLSGVGPVNIVAFSPDSKRIAVGGSDSKLRVYSVPGGRLELEVMAGTMEGLAAGVWLPDSCQMLMVGSRELQIIDVNAGGASIDRLALGQHTYDAVVSHDGGTVITVGQDRRLRFLRLSDRREMFIGPEPASVTCLSTSPDGRFLASNMNTGVIHLWPLGDMRAAEPLATAAPRPGASDPLDALPAAPIQEYRLSEGHQGRFVIRSAFGGAGYSFLASGSEGVAGAVHIWHRESGEMLAALEGHTGTVNAVAWNPRNQYMMASCSDDGTVRIWLAPGRN